MSSFTTERRTEEERDETRADEDKLWGGDILWANGKLESQEWTWSHILRLFHSQDQ